MYSLVALSCPEEIPCTHAGIADRMQKITALVLAIDPKRIKVIASSDRKYTTWIGGSILPGFSVNFPTDVDHQK